MDLARHRSAVRKQFALEARLHPKTLKLRHAENVVPLLELAQPQPTDRVLDVASGWGFVALEFAPRVKSVFGVDLTPAMAGLGEEVRRRKDVANVAYGVGDAEALRLAPGSFEIVTCRLSFHHFPRPLKALAEMKRMLAPGGRIVIYDILANPDPKRARVQNRIESERDPSHVRMYTPAEYERFFQKAGLKECGRIVTLWKRDFDQWMDFVGAAKAKRKRVRTLLEKSIEGNKAGLGPRVRDGQLTFTHTCGAWLLIPA